MLAASVDAVEGFFMEKADKAVLLRCFFHDFHGELVVVNRHVGSIENRGQFVLGRSHFVVFCLGRNAQFP